jgi:hypothetical protein
MGLSPEVLLVNWNEVDEWMWIEQQGSRLGVARTTIRVETLPENHRSGALPDYFMDNRWRLKFRVMGLSLPVDAATHVRMNGNLEMETLQARVRIAGRMITLQSFVEQNSLFYEARVQPDTTKTTETGLMAAILPNMGDFAALPFLEEREVRGRAPLQGPMMLDEVIAPIIMRRGELAEGQTWQIRISDPIGGLVEQTVRVRVEAREQLHIAGKPVEAWRLSEDTDELQTTAWYDNDGKLLRREAYGGLVWERAQVADVLENDPGFRQDVVFDPIDQDHIKHNLTPELDGKPIQALLPSMPRL